MVVRSLLFAPGNEPRKLARVGSFGADGIILDLEDSVPPDMKTAARDAVRDAAPSAAAAGGLVYIRVNPFSAAAAFSVDCGADDVAAVACHGLDGFVVPKVESADDVLRVDEAVCAAERERGLPAGGLEIVPLIESAAGLWNAYEIARASPRVRLLLFGAADFTRDLGIDWSRDETELAYARSRLAVASRAAGVAPPVDSVWARLDDDEGLARSAAEARRLGFQGKMCIHPRQVPIVNRGFSTVAPEEVDHARRVVDAFAEAESRGSASIVVDGRFVDYPMVEKAKRTLELHTMSEAG